MKTNTIHSFTLNNDNTFTENVLAKGQDKADELKTKFGYLALDVVNEVLDAISHEDNVMYYEIKFWNSVKEVLENKS